MKQLRGIYILFFLTIILSSTAQLSEKFPMVPGIPVVHSPKSSGAFLGTPSIVKLKNGDFLYSHDFFGPSVKKDIVHIYRSVDKGKTWTFQAEIRDAFWCGMFVAGGDVYLLGVNGASRNLAIWKSHDNGKTWSAPSILRHDRCHGSSTPFVFANGRIYKGYDHLGDEVTKKWMSDNRSFIMSARLDSDLMNPASWSYTNEITKPSEMDGTGWLETNAVLSKNGKIMGITRIANESGLIAGYYELASDTAINPQSVGSINFIGGATKFNVKWDEKTQLYWSLTNYPPDVLRKPKMRAGGMRSVLSLISSPDLNNWKINAIVLASEDVTYHGFQYVDWLFDGKDIVFASRTGYDDGQGGADNAHNSNFMTFHRIKNYVKVKTPKKYQYLLVNTKDKK